MIILFIFFSLFKFDLVMGDLIMEPPLMDNYVSMDNIIASTFWAAGVCSCVGLVCKHKQKLPIKVEPNKIYGEECYEISYKSKSDLHRLKNDLEEMKKAIKYLEDEIKNDEVQKIINDNNLSMEIPNDIKYKYGKAPIRFKKDGKYYHGIDPTFYSSWDKSGVWTKEHIGCMFHYTNKEVKLPHEEWDTHEIKDFCHNCSFCTDKNKRKKTRFIYRCNGHSI